MYVTRRRILDRHRPRRGVGCSFPRRCFISCHWCWGGQPALTQSRSSSTPHRADRPSRIGGGMNSAESRLKKCDLDMLSRKAASLASTRSLVSAPGRCSFASETGPEPEFPGLCVSFTVSSPTSAPDGVIVGHPAAGTTKALGAFRFRASAQVPGSFPRRNRGGSGLPLS